MAFTGGGGGLLAARMGFGGAAEAAAAAAAAVAQGCIGSGGGGAFELLARVVGSWNTLGLASMPANKSPGKAAFSRGVGRLVGLSLEELATAPGFGFGLEIFTGGPLAFMRLVF